MARFARTVLTAFLTANRFTLPIFGAVLTTRFAVFFAVGRLIVPVFGAVLTTSFEDVFAAGRLNFPVLARLARTVFTAFFTTARLTVPFFGADLTTRFAAARLTVADFADGLATRFAVVAADPLTVPERVDAPTERFAGFVAMLFCPISVRDGAHLASYITTLNQNTPDGSPRRIEFEASARANAGN